MCAGSSIFFRLDILCLHLPKMCSVSHAFLKKTGCVLAVLFTYTLEYPEIKFVKTKRHKKTKSRLYFLRIFFTYSTDICSIHSCLKTHSIREDKYELGI